MAIGRAGSRSVHAVLLVDALVVGALAACALAACGGGNTSYGGPGPLPPATLTVLTATPPSSASASAPPSASGSAALPPVPRPVPPGAKLMNTPRPTELAGELAKIGLDVKRLPKLGDLPPRQLRDVMELFKTSLGVRCTDCHLDDYAAPTRRKKIAQHMWDDFVGKLTTEDGGPVFCDSCHQGHAKQLDRHDKAALMTAMSDSFVDKLRRSDGQEHKCTTCHSSLTDYAILDKWAAGR